MSVRVKLPTILRKHAGGEALVDAEGATLRDLLANLESRYPGITKNIVADDGGLHRFINVYVNDEDVRYLGALETSVNEGDTVSILPAVAGGRAQATDPEDPGCGPERRPPHQGEIVRTTS
jgi:molybdopterin synthase sulfur carrier subunit